MAPSHLAIILPMYNEENNAERCVREICAVLQRSVPGSKLVAVNDGSKDNTAAVLERLSKENLPLIFVDCKVNRGYGAALLTGARAAEEAGFTFGLFMDSDLTNDPELIPQFAEKTRSGQYDVVK